MTLHPNIIKLTKVNSIIKKKKSQQALLSEEINFMVDGYTSENIMDDIMSDWIKAIYDNGMNKDEILSYTKAMLFSGITLDFSYLDGYVIDKHSTGGVGDKVSLILGPILAACGYHVPMIAGRGLEYTGGTIDKLESIPGYNAFLSIENFKKNVEKIGISIMSQTDDICPADKKIYELRDRTKMVASFPLICGSIMSKKIAEGIEGLILDIKVGNGAFMKEISDGKKLGTLLKSVGELYGIKVYPCYTNMDQPLGDYAGLWCEVLESIECLKGNGPEDLMNVIYYLIEKAFYLSGINFNLDEIKGIINDGSALNKFFDMVIAHGGLIKTFEDSKINAPLYKEKIFSIDTGFISFMDTELIGLVLSDLCGRHGNSTNALDPSAGIKFHKKNGNYVDKDDLVMEYFCSNKSNFDNCKYRLQKSFHVQSEHIFKKELIYK